MSNMNLTPPRIYQIPPITTFYMNIHLFKFITPPSPQKNYRFQVNFSPPYLLDHPYNQRQESTCCTKLFNPQMCNGYYMRACIRKHIYWEARKRPDIPTTWQKMPDEMFGIWMGSKQEFFTAIEILNQCHHNIKIRPGNITHQCKLFKCNNICWR